MEDNKKFRLRLNLFDGIVLVLALALCAFLLWSHFKPAAADPESGLYNTIQYTIRMKKFPAEESGRVKVGDVLSDNVKNKNLGTVAAVRVEPSSTVVLDQINHQYIENTYEGYNDIEITLESNARLDTLGVELESGYLLRVGETVYIHGVGYFGSGPIIEIDREGLE